MVSRIEVIPSEVRGYGNIVGAKSLEDFVPVNSEISYSEDVYSLTAATGVRILLSASSTSVTYGSSVVLSATVIDEDSPVVGESVSFYDGETLLGSEDTDSSGVASYTVSALSIGLHGLSAVYDEKTSNVVNVTVNKITSTVSLSASSSTITYGDSVTLSGTLSVGSGESVKIYQGSTLLDTVTTGTGGAFTKSVSGLAVGSHTFKATYDGDSTHSEASSSNVNVAVNKLTPSISLSVPSTGTVGTSYTVSGTLTPSSGSVKLYENSVLKDTLTVSSGSFSKSITQNSEGTYSYYAVFEGSSTYDSITSSTSSIVVSDAPAPIPASVSLTSDKSILSYADSESATLSATVLDSSSNPIEGVTVEFFKGSTSLGTADTNSSGVATKSYASAGVGDISLKAQVGSLSSEIYVVDAYKYTADGSGLDGTFTVSDGYITGCQSNTGITSFNLNTDFEMSFQHYINSSSVSSPDYNALWNIGQDSNNGVLIGVEGAEKRIRIYNRSNASNTSVQVQTNSYNTQTWNTFIIRYVNGVWSITSGDYTLSYSKSFTPAFIRLNSNFTSTRLKEFMIKPL